MQPVMSRSRQHGQPTSPTWNDRKVHGQYTQVYDEKDKIGTIVKVRRYNWELKNSNPIRWTREPGTLLPNSASRVNLWIQFFCCVYSHSLFLFRPLLSRIQNSCFDHCHLQCVPHHCHCHLMSRIVKWFNSYLSHLLHSSLRADWCEDFHFHWRAQNIRGRSNHRHFLFQQTSAKLFLLHLTVAKKGESLFTSVAK